MFKCDELEQCLAEYAGGTAPENAAQREEEYRRYVARSGQRTFRSDIKTHLHAKRYGPIGSEWKTIAVYTEMDGETYLINRQGAPVSLRSWISWKHPDKELSFSYTQASPVQIPSWTAQHDVQWESRLSEQGRGMPVTMLASLPGRTISERGTGWPVKWTDEQRQEYMDEMGSADQLVCLCRRLLRGCPKNR